MFRKILEGGPAIALIPALSLFIGATFLGLYGAYTLLESLYLVFRDPETQDPTVLSTRLISILDIHLLSVVLYIFAVGLYELFVGELRLPSWLKIGDIDDLKVKLTSVVILILAITFTKNTVKWKDPLGSLYFGLAIAGVILALVFYAKAKDKA